MSLYQTVAAGSTNTTLAAGGGGATGDMIERLVVNISLPLTGTVQLKDGSGTAFTVFGVGTILGTWILELNIVSKTGAWQITTGGGASVVAIGSFT